MKKNMLFGILLAALVLIAGHVLNGAVQWIFRDELRPAEGEAAPIALIAAGGALLFVAGVLAQYLLIRWSYERIPGRGYLTKGIFFGLIYLVAGRQFFTTSYVTGIYDVPLWLMLLDFVTGAVFVLAASVILAYYVEEARKPDPALPR